MVSPKKDVLRSRRPGPRNGTSLSVAHELKTRSECPDGARLPGSSRTPPAAGLGCRGVEAGAGKARMRLQVADWEPCGTCLTSTGRALSRAQHGGEWGRWGGRNHSSLRAEPVVACLRSQDCEGGSFTPSESSATWHPCRGRRNRERKAAATTLGTSEVTVESEFHFLKDLVYLFLDSVELGFGRLLHEQIT